MEQVKVAETKKIGINWPLSIICLLVLGVAVGFIAIKPEESVGAIGNVFHGTMSATGPFMLMFDLFMIIFGFGIAISKYGRIKLGEGEPEYSMFSYIAMMACAALASASMFWSFTEWAYYNVTPGLGIEPLTQEAMEMGLGYAFFHWGFLAQCTYVCIGLMTAYALYVRKMNTLKISDIAMSMIEKDHKWKAPLKYVIDFIVVFCTLGGLGVSLGLGIPVIAGGINTVTGLESNFLMQLIIVAVLAVIFSWSSFVGTGRGMKFLSDNTVKLLFVLIGFIFVFGPTSFIQKMLVSALGKMVQWYPAMATFTDPISNSGFAEDWTIFFIAFPLTYAGLMGAFVAKISKGRSVRCLVLACMFGISVGTWVFFGINSGLAMDRELSGDFSMINEVMNGDPYKGVFALLGTLPLGKILAVVYTVCVAGFICTTMDTASLCLASTTVKSLDKDANPSKKSRLFWCIMLTLLPLSILFSGAEFDALKKIAILVSCLLAIVMLFMMIGFMKWLKKDRKTKGMLTYVKDDFVDLD